MKWELICLTLGYVKEIYEQHVLDPRAWPPILHVLCNFLHSDVKQPQTVCFEAALKYSWWQKSSSPQNMCCTGRLKIYSFGDQETGNWITGLLWFILWHANHRNNMERKSLVFFLPHSGQASPANNRMFDEQTWSGPCILLLTLKHKCNGKTYFAHLNAILR